MTASQFAAYRVIIIGDPTCGDSVGTDTAAYSNRTTWEPVVMSSGGNKVLIGTDPVYHFLAGEAPNANVLIGNGIAYAGAVSGATGVYMDLSCTEDLQDDPPGTPVPILDGLSKYGAGQFTVGTEAYYGACATGVNIIANTGPTLGLTDADLSNWDCSVHEDFDKFPADYTPLALAPTTSGFPPTYCGTDVETQAQVCGAPYILVSGSGVVSGGASKSEQGGATPSAEYSTTCHTKRPVNCATGVFWHTFQDAHTQGGKGLPLDLTRTYSSLNASSDGPFGYGWTDSYNMSLSLDSSGNASITSPDGSTVTFSPNGSGGFIAPPRVLASLVENAGGSYTYSTFAGETYGFNASGQLVSEADRNGQTTTLSYSDGQLTTVTDASGRTLTFGYSGNRVSSVTDPAGNTWSYSYDSAGNLASVSDPLHRTWSFGYDANHLLTSMTDPNGGTTSNVYNGNGQVVSQTDPANRTTTWAYSGDPTTTAGSTTTITDPDGDVTTETYEDLQLQSVTRGAGTPQAATTSYQYDPNTLGITQITDPDGGVTTNTYDAHGNLLTTTDPRGNTTTYTYNGLNEVASKTDALGTTTTYSYDSNGNLTSEATPLTGGGTATTTYTFGSGAAAGEQLSSTNPDGKKTTYGYNADGDQTSVTDPAGNQTTATYDALGNQLTLTTPDGGTTTNVYDADSELTNTTNALGKSASYSYDGDGNQTSVTNALGQTTTYTYDADDEQTAVTQPNGSVSRTSYDGDGNVTAQTDGNGHTTSYSYDPLNRVASTTDADGRTTTYGYDGNGNLTSKVDPAGRTTSYDYNAGGDQTSISYSDSSTPNVSESYDADDQRTSMTDGTGTSSYSYDTLGDLVSETNGDGATTNFSYDPASQLTAITYPNGQTVDRTYTDDGQLKTVTDWLGNTTTFGYNSDGDETSEDLPGSVTAASTYDAADQLMGITDSRGSTNLASFNYQRDALGQVTNSAASGSVSGNNAYSYDSDDRLSSDNGTSFGYDSANDPTTYVNGQAQTFDAADQLLTSGGTPQGGNGGSGGAGGSGSGSGSGGSGNGGGNPPPRAHKTFAEIASVASSTTLRRSDLQNSLTTGKPNELVLAFVSAQLDGPAHGSARLTSHGLHWKPVATRLTGHGFVQVWAALTGKIVKRLSVGAQLPHGAVQALLSLVAFQPGAKLGRASSYSGRKGAPALKLRVTSGAMVLALGHDSAEGSARRALAGNHLIKQVRSTKQHDDSWLQRYQATRDGEAVIGDKAPRSTAWALAGIVVEPGVSTSATARSALLLAAANGPESFGYNAEGDRTSVTTNSGTTTLGYDQANQLTSVGSSISYAYDGDGLRTSKTVNGATTQFAWDESGNLPLLVQDGSTSYIYGPNGQPIEQITGGTPTYLLGDQQGSTRLLTDSNGDVVGTYSYDAWGNVTSHTGSATNLQYDGQYTDPETGYQYLRARYYDPSSGQFLSVDAANALSRQPYSFAADDPASFADPSGMYNASACAIFVCVSYDSGGGGFQVGPGTSRTPGAEIGIGNFGIGTPGIGATATANGGHSTESIGACLIICYSRSATQTTEFPAPVVDCASTDPSVQDLEYCSADDPSYTEDLLGELNGKAAAVEHSLGSDAPGSASYESDQACLDEINEIRQNLIKALYEQDGS